LVLSSKRCCDLDLLKKELKMNKSYEVCILIDDENYVDQLIISLVRQGYSVYLSYDEKSICFTVDDGEVTEIKKA